MTYCVTHRCQFNRRENVKQKQHALERKQNEQNLILNKRLNVEANCVAGFEIDSRIGGLI